MRRTTPTIDRSARMARGGGDAAPPATRRREPRSSARGAVSGDPPGSFGMRRANRSRAGAFPLLRGITLIEVVFASLLFAVVGSAMLGFLSATAQGGQARQRISDPALESVLAIRRFRTVAPEFRTTLEIGPSHALVWLNDLVPSRSVHASEVGVLRFDEEQGVLLLESVSEVELGRDRALEREFRVDRLGGLLAWMEDLREDGLLTRALLAEGLEEVGFAPDPSRPGSIRVTFAVEGNAVEFLLVPEFHQEPLR